MALMASEAVRQLGPCPDELSRSEADLRIFAHDLLHWSRDKDYRTLAAFPVAALSHHTLGIVRMSTHGELSTEVIQGLNPPDEDTPSIWLLVHQGHMRTMRPNDLTLSPPVIRSVMAAGWECHLEAAQGSEATVRAQTYLRCPRCEQHEEEPRRSGSGSSGRRPPVFGLHDLYASRIGGWTPGPLELKDLPSDATFPDSDFRGWLGDQAHFFDQACVRGLDFLEMYAGAGRATLAVRAAGGIALCLGLDHGQDFRLARDRALALALIDRLKPHHVWLSFPCTSFCAWIRLAVLRGCDLEPRLREGRLHLRFACQLADKQVASSRQAHMENPLPSSAWKEPRMLQTMQATEWHRARLDQCQTGLSSPAGSPS